MTTGNDLWVPAAMASDFDGGQHLVALTHDYLEHRFLSSEPGHGLHDVYREHLSRSPDALARVRALRPDGPLAVSYNRASDNRPKVNRFDLIMVSDEFRTEHAGYHYTDALSVGSDHALLEAVVCPG